MNWWLINYKYNIIIKMESEVIMWNYHSKIIMIKVGVTSQESPPSKRSVRWRGSMANKIFGYVLPIL
jgi:hypothetical protein